MKILPCPGLVSARVETMGYTCLVVEIEFAHVVEYRNTMVESHPQRSFLFKDSECGEGESIRVVLSAEEERKIFGDAHWTCQLVRGHLFDNRGANPKGTIFKFVLIPDGSGNRITEAVWTRGEGACKV